MKPDKNFELLNVNLRFEQVLFYHFIKINSSVEMEQFKDLVEKLEACIYPYMEEKNGLGLKRHNEFIKESKEKLDKLKKQNNPDLKELLAAEYEFIVIKYKSLMRISYWLGLLPQKEIKMKVLK